MPRIYVACLASYNNGTLHGAWIDAAQDADDISSAIAAMLSASKEPGAEEWAIHDYEGFAGLKLSESHDLADVAALAELIEEHGAELVKAAGEVTSETDAEGLSLCIEERYRGEFDSVEDYAAQFVEDCYSLKDIPEGLRNYIDYEAMGQDMEMGGDICTARVGGTLYIFDNA